MKINEILVESQQISEGPLGSAAGAVARGAGKVIGGVAKGVGALAGIPGGIKKAFQKGKQASTDFIGGDKKAADADGGEAPAQATPTAQQSQPAAQPAAQGGGGFVQGFKQGMGMGGGQAPAATTTSQVNKQGPSGTAPAQVSGAAQQQALAKTAQAAGGDPNKAAQTLYATVKAQVNQLDKKGKQRLLQLLQKSIQQTPAQPAAAAAQPATGPGSKTAGTTAAGQPKVEPDLNAPATAAPAAAKSAVGTEQPATAAGKKQPTPKKKVAPSQAEIDADRARIMGTTTDSVIRKGNLVAESFTLYRR